VGVDVTGPDIDHVLDQPQRHEIVATALVLDQDVDEGVFAVELD
jgi:hypothetical protein